MQEVFQARLTELEATGIQVVSAQVLANGKSIELAQQEMLRAASLGVVAYVSITRHILPG